MHWYKLLAYFPDERGNKRKFYCNALFIERALKKRAIEIKRGGGDLRYFEHIFEPLGSFIRSSEFDYILTPPGTEDTSFAQKIAERLSRESGVPYINYFEPHRHKRRVIREKFNKINLKKKEGLPVITGRWIFLIDDFAYTRQTLYLTTEALQEIGNRVFPAVLYA
jgi:adenine/guanine phosphoribosyltransferase-like PRPP-binding protein